MFPIRLVSMKYVQDSKRLEVPIDQRMAPNFYYGIGARWKI
jgi:hypothetical protein